MSRSGPCRLFRTLLECRSWCTSCLACIQLTADATCWPHTTTSRVDSLRLQGACQCLEDWWGVGVLQCQQEHGLQCVTPQSNSVKVIAQHAINKAQGGTACQCMPDSIVTHDTEQYKQHADLRCFRMDLRLGPALCMAR